MSIDGCITSGSGQVLSIPVGDVLTCLRVSESLGEPKINYIDVMLLLANSDEEIIWLYVSVEKMPRVHELNSL